MRRLLLALPLLLAGCAQNAFLELEIDLPPNPFKSRADRYAVVRVVSGEVPYDQIGDVHEPLAAPLLDASTRTTYRVSIEGSSGSADKVVRVRVRFCRDPHCVSVGDDLAPEVRMQIERAFYIGKRTTYKWVIPCVPNVKDQTEAPPTCDTAQHSVHQVPKCSVAGCRPGVATEHCTGDKKHFCE